MGDSPVAIFIFLYREDLDTANASANWTTSKSPSDIFDFITEITLSKIEQVKKSHKKILSDKNALNLIAQYNAIIDHNAEVSEAELKAKIAHAAKLERERELAEEQARQLSELENQRDWTIGLDPTENSNHTPQSISNSFSIS